MEDNFFGGFEAIASHISNSDPDVTQVKNSRVETPIVDPEDPTGGASMGDDIDPDKIDRSFTPPIPKGDDVDDDDDLVDDVDNDQDDDDLKDLPARKDTKPKADNSQADDDDDVTDLGSMEADVTAYVQEKLFANLGIPVQEDNKLESIDDVSKFIVDTINEYSIPEFANETVADIDSYVRNGGDLAYYMENVHGGTNLDTVDIDNIDHQKSLVREDLKNQGLSDSRIQRKLERMEDGGTLAEEAEDALESLKEYKEKMAEKLLKDQENQAKVIKEQQRQYITDVEATINEIDNIRSIPLTAAEKKELFNYIFKPVDNTGQTQYQKDYISNNRNLVESAYFTMKGDKLIDKVEKKANSKAARDLKTKLAQKGKRGKNQTTQKTTSSSDSWGIISQQLRNRKF